MNKTKFCAGLILASLPAAGVFADSLVSNGDFESYDEKGKLKNWYLPQHYKAMRGEGSNGSGGLVYENRTDPTYYQNASQRVDMRPGCSYRFGGWVKIDEISGKGGVALFVSWYDENGKYLGETQTSLLRKPTDGWVKLEGISKPVAANAAKASVATVVQRGVLGRIAFDKLYVERHVRKPVVGVYTSAYRREATAGKVSFAAALTPEAFPAGKNVEVKFAVKRPDGGTFALETSRPAADEARSSADVGRFGLGTNRVVCAVTAEGKLVGKAETTFVRTAMPTRRTVSIDRYGRTLVDGKLFFPLGMYTGQMTAESVAMYKESDFNCIMQYGSPVGAQMDLFRKNGIKVIYDIASQYQASDKGTNHVRNAIRKFGDHPSVLAWYIYDEKPTSMLPLLEARQRLVEELDPDHPTWCAQDIFSETRHYLGACDVFGGDPYPVSTRPVSVATDAMRTEQKGLMGMRPIWQVVQAFGWNWISEAQAKRQRRPSEPEIRNMAWQAIAGGARGLIFYSFGYLCREMERREPVEILWPELKRISAEIKKHERVLLFADSQAIADDSLPKGVVGRIFRENGEEWKLLVNTSSTEAVGSLGLAPLGMSFSKTGPDAFRLGDITEVVYDADFTDKKDAKGAMPHIWGYSAAVDLAKALSRVTGGKVAYAKEGKAASGKGVRIFVGNTKAAREAGLDAGKLMRGEFRIVTRPGEAFILSNTGMGATYGVAEFLQRYADYWFCLVSGDDPYVVAPERTVPIVDFAAKHAMYVRNYNMWGRRYPKTCATVGGDFTRRLRCRTWWPELEGKFSFSKLPGPYNPSHTFFAYCQPEKYAKEHPEYFSMGPDGQRHFKANSGSQLCLTNPDVFDIVWSNLCAFIEKDRAEFGENAPTVYDFSQMDNCSHLCLCPQCREVASRYDRKGGHKDGGDAGLQLEFVNRLAKKAAAKYPGVVIRTFAYVTTDVPPKGGIVPEPNVLIWYCDLYSKCDDMLPLEHPFNSRSLGLLREWRKLTPNIEVWDYYLNSGTWVAPDAIAADIRLFKELGIDRIGPETTFRRQPFFELNVFVTSQLYFDPDQDVDFLVGKWCRVYGKGAAKMEKAICFLRRIILGNPPKDYAGYHNGVWPWRTPENLEKFCSMVKAAYAEESEGSVYRSRMAAPLADVSKYLMRLYKSAPGRRADYERMRSDYRKYALEDLAQSYVAPVEAARDRKEVEDTLALMDLEFHDLPEELEKTPREDLHFVDWRNMYVAYGRKEAVTNGVPQPQGVAYRWMATQKKEPPFNCSMLDEDLQTNHLHPFTPAADGKWHWIKIATDRLGRGGWVGLPYVGDNSISFRIQHLYVESDGLEKDPNRYEMWISCKYGGDVTDPEKGLFIDRLVLRRVDER